MKLSRIEALEQKMVVALETVDEKAIEACMKKMLPILRKQK